MKRIFFWITILTLILVSINNEESIEISDRSIVHAVGIDREEDGVTVTLQIFKSSGAGADTQLDPSKANVLVISNTAKNFDQAMTKCESQLGSNLFIGHNQIIVLGSKVNFKDPTDLFSYFIQNKNNYLGVDVVMAEKTAKEVLQVELNLGVIAAENFSEILKKSYDNGTSIRCDMLHFLNSIEKKDKSALLPVVTIRQSTEKDDSKSESSSKTDKQQQEGQSGVQPIMQIKKAVIIHNGEVVGDIDTKAISGLNWMSKDMNTSVVNINVEDTPLGISLKERSTHISLKKSDNGLTFKVDIKATILTQDNILNSYDKNKVKKAVEEKVLESCQSAIDKGYDEYNADILDVLHYVRFYYPQIFLDYEDNFDELKKHISFDVNVECLTR